MGLILSFLNSLFDSLSDVFNKYALRITDEYAAAIVLRFLISIFLFPLLIHQGLPSIGKNFLLALAISGTLNAITTVLCFKALKMADISETIPLLSFTPLFMLVFSPLILKELPGTAGITGIILIVLGSYYLNLEKEKGLLFPIRALFTKTSSLFILLVAFLWSITSVYDKMGVLNSSPLFWIVTINLYISALTFIFFLITERSIEKLKKQSWNILGATVLAAISSVCQMTAIKLIPAAYVIAIKRSNGILSVILGKLFFKEKNFQNRLAGAIIMAVGMIIIIFFG